MSMTFKEGKLNCIKGKNTPRFFNQRTLTQAETYFWIGWKTEVSVRIVNC
jgi:hypothetical protein